MLQTLNAGQRKMLQLASYLDGLATHVPQFNMRDWNFCAVGHAHCLFNKEDRRLGNADERIWAATTFEISEADAIALFHPQVGSRERIGAIYNCTAKQMAKLLRHFVATGDVNWPLALAKSPNREEPHPNGRSSSLGDSLGLRPECGRELPVDRRPTATDPTDRNKRHLVSA